MSEENTRENATLSDDADDVINDRWYHAFVVTIPLAILIMILGSVTGNDLAVASYGIIGAGLIFLFMPLFRAIWASRRENTATPPAPTAVSAPTEAGPDTRSSMPPPAVPVPAAATRSVARPQLPSTPTAPDPVDIPTDLPPLETPAGGLVNVVIRHSAGTSTVTEDLDTPMPQRSVSAADAHGRPEQLLVRVDENGRVIEAAVPGGEWGPAVEVR
jgi:hypothetical protein